MAFPQKNSPDTNTDWLTPPAIIKALGEFDLDPCCPPVMPWRTAREMISSKADSIRYACGCSGDGLGGGLVCPGDGMKMAWKGRVWLNPPFRGAGDWMRRMREHGNGIALLPCATDTDIFFHNVWGHASGIFFIKRRVIFFRPDGSKPKNNINRPCCLVAYRNQNLEAVMQSGLKGALVVEVGK